MTVEFGMPQRSTLARVREALWYLMLVTLPVSTFPPLSAFFGTNPVKPIALILLVPLGLLWVASQRGQDTRMPWQLWPLILFTLLAAVSIFAASFLPMTPIKGHDILLDSVAAYATLLIGLAFFIVAATSIRSERTLRWSLRAITFGAVLMLFWSSVQATYVLSEGRRVPLILNNIHRFIVDRDLIYNRVSGFAYEPSWQGNQLMVLYLPIWGASIVSGVSAFPRLGKKIPLEALLFPWGLAILLLTQSRNSYLTLVFMAGIAILYGGWKLSGRIPRLRQPGGRFAAVSRVLIRLLLLLVLLGLFSALLMGIAWGISKVDRRMPSLLQIPSRLPEFRALYPNETLYEAANRLAFAERLVYWEAAYRVFERYPLLGVGLGNEGFLFPETVPAYGFRLAEIQYVLDPVNMDLANPKNLWIRLLAETGILGSSAFLCWYIVMAATSIWLVKSEVGYPRMLGMMGVGFLLAQIVEGFSLDTFALPYIWITSGLILTGAALEHRLQGGGRPQSDLGM